MGASEVASWHIENFVLLAKESKSWLARAIRDGAGQRAWVLCLTTWTMRWMRTRVHAARG